MEKNKILTNAVDQGIGSQVAYINQLRADELLENLSRQDINLENALNELNQLRQTVHGTLQGSPLTEHGIIAEHAQVNTENARNYVEGKKPIYRKEPDLASPVDYYEGDTPVQSKFLNGSNQDGVQTIKNTLTSENGIAGHLKKYPDFLKKGGIYQVPRDQYDYAVNLLSKSPSEMSTADYKTLQAIREFEKANNVKFEDVIQPSDFKYSEVQRNVIDDTINKEETGIRETDESRRAEFRQNARATVRQGLQVAAVSAAIEGVASFASTVLAKFKQGKKVKDFTEDDWKEIFADTAGASVKGGVRGASVYALTNLVHANAAVATSLVTITFGAVSLTSKFAKGEITSSEYVDGLQRSVVETGVSAAGAAIGQALIPVPVVGAVVGSMVGSVILGGIQKAASKELQDSQFLVDIETAYIGMAEKIYNSEKVFKNSMVALARQQDDFERMKAEDERLSSELDALSNSI